MRKFIFIFIIITLLSNIYQVYGQEYEKDAIHHDTIHETVEKETVEQNTEEAEKWGALDEVVIEKLAKEKGKEVRPFIELEGDLILFVFSLFSAIGGFIIGYYSKVIFSKK
ncbi:MAG: hypothetical protein ACK4F9_04875 [Brevinematia bacterium]